ncbi:hypothetical protein GM418_10925 [Maribellus comscasis]|uniref:Uncharacterized protein n=1 Tax=Maribellus comscasis TaxID=2681766 RepID=A0A6I6JYD8_9BACT|nr:hypothetical protein [Maribellus comscasis]QGY44153.1 hypothetical protein GM418_10925 [Maribellus comscasis]
MGENSKYNSGPIFELIKRFDKIDLEERFSHLEAHMFLKLLLRNNSLGWKEWFKYPNSRLESDVGTRSKNLITARQKLIDSGIIDYKKGTTRNAGSYSLLSKLQSIEPTKESNQESNLESKKEGNKGNINKTKPKTKPKQLLLTEVVESTLSPPENEYFKIALSFHQLIRNNLHKHNLSTTHVDKAKYKNWVDPIRLLIENDGKTKHEIREVWKLLEINNFYQKIVQKTEKLRMKMKSTDQLWFDAMLYELRNGNKKRTNNGHSSNNEQSKLETRKIAKQAMQDAG